MRFRHVLLVSTALVAGVTAATGATAAAGPALGEIRNAGGSTAVADSYIVVLKDGFGKQADGAIAARYGAAVEHHYTSAIRGFSVRASATAAKRLAADPSVAYVEQNHVVKVDDTQLNPVSWGIDRIDQRNLPLSNSYTYPANAGAGVRIYVVDTGIRLTHQDFGGRAVDGVDLVDNALPGEDCHGHGSHVAGTAVGTTLGVAKAATVVNVRVFGCDGTGNVARTTAAVDWITANAVKPAVVNMSLGYPDYTNPGILETAVTNSIASGITYAVSAGNDNNDACLKVPARVPAAITVAASEKTDSTWPSSNEGPCVDLFAPGLNVISAHYTSDTVLWTRSGTSMAAPHVAGAAAIVLTDHPTWTPQQVRDDIVARATSGVLNWVTAGTVNLLLYVGP